MDRIMNLVKCSWSDASLLYGSMTSKTLLKVPRWLWSLLLLCFITVNALFIAMCLSVDTSSILHYKSYDCKYIDEAAPSIIEYKGADSSSTYYYYVLNITMYHDDAGANGQDLTVLPSILWDDFCKTPTSEESKKCLEEYIGSDHDDSFTCYAVQSNVEKFATKKINSVGGNSINISLGKEMTQSYISELYWTIPLALVIVLIIIVGYILFGFFYFEGRSKFSLDRFIRQVIKDPFMLSGDSTTYRLEESSSMNVILQDPTERHKEVLLRLDKRALALSSENQEDEEPISQLQEIALSSLDTNDDGNKVHPVYLLMRSTATEEHETLLYYERPSTENMKRSRKSTLRMLLILWILIIPTFFIMFILAILSLVLLESIIIALCLWELSIIIVFFITHTSLVKLIPVYQGIHYLITSSRVVIVETLPLKLGYTLYCITHDKIGQVWHGSLNESHPTTHVTLEDRKEGQLLAEIKTNKDEAVNGILFEYCTDVRSSIDLIEHRQGNSSNFSIE